LKRTLIFVVAIMLMLNATGSMWGSATEPPVNFQMIEDVSVTFDSSEEYLFSILHADDYPCMEINSLATVMGGTVEGGNTLVKGNVRITYTEGSKLARDMGGHIMLERAPSVHSDELFVPVSSLLPTFGYTMYYNRFAKTLEIKSGTDYPEPELTVYARDYGAVGDGVHDDLHPILEAIDVAISSGVPSKVELDANKTYLVGARHDAQAIFLFENVENFTLDGKGSEIIIDKATNSPFDIRNCTNLKIQNLEVDYNELTYTQGRITYIDKENHTFRLEIDEGHLLPADDAWVHHFWGPTALKEPHLGGWSFGTVMDPTEDRIHLDRKYDEIFVKTVTPYENREYELTVLEGYYANLNEVEVGDRFVLNTRFNTYDIGTETLDGLIRTAVQIYMSGDITFENVNLYQAHWNGFNMGMCWGRIFLKNVGVKTKPGRLMACNSDTFHMWRCRAGVVMDGCTFENNMDDHMNTKTESGFILEHDEYSYVINYDLNIRIGDELMFMNAVRGGTVLGTAFVKDIEIAHGQGWRVTVDRPVEGIVDGTEGLEVTKVFNLDSCARGNIVKNSTFRNSRRSPYLCKSPNTIFDNNIIENCGGSGFKGVPESAAAGKREGVYPSSCTVRNNTMTYEGQIQPNGPIAIYSDSTPIGGQAKIKDVLLENNTITSNNPNNFIYIHSVDGLYMYDNTLISRRTDMPETNTPVIIRNSRVNEIDGVTLDFARDVEVAVTLSGCEVDTNNIKNISVLNGNSAQPYEALEYVDEEINYRDDIYWMNSREQSIEGDVLLASVDFKVSSDALQGFCLRFISGDTVPVGAVRFNKHGLVVTEDKAQSWGATWLEQVKNLDSPYALTTYERDVWYNLKVRLDKKSGTVDYYLNGEWIGQDEGDLSGWSGHWTHITPVGLDASQDFFEWEVRSITQGGEGLYEILVHDEENKTLSIDFSEAIEEPFEDVELKNINTKGDLVNVPLTKLPSVGTELRFAYSEPLDLNSEYVIILPKAPVSKASKESMDSRYIYFDTKDADFEADEIFDFESDETSFLVDIANGNYISGQNYYTGGGIVDSDSSHGKAFQLNNVISHMNGSSKWGEFNWNGPIGVANKEITAYSFDIKPIKSDMQTAIRIKDGTSRVPFSLAFGKSGYILGGFNWFDKWSTNIDDIESHIRYEYYIGEYEADKWINFRMEFDNFLKLARIYMDGELIKTIPYENYGSTDSGGNSYGVKWASFVVHSDHMTEENEPLLLLDNVKTEIVNRPVGVKRVKFADNGGNTVGAYDFMENAVSEIDVYFDEDVMLSDAQNEHIKLLYDGREIAYSAKYSSEERCYTLIPVESPLNGNRVEVSVQGLTVRGRAVEGFSAFAHVGQMGVWLGVTDSEGNEIQSFDGKEKIYVSLYAQNNSDTDETIYVLTAQYDAAGELIGVDHARSIEVKKKESVRLGADSQDVMVVVPHGAARTIKTFVWKDSKSLIPLCQSVVVRK